MSFKEIWENFYFSAYFIKTIFGILVVALVFAVIYFIDGIKKYAYWLKKED